MEYGTLNSTKSSKSHHVKKRGAPVYDVNTKTVGAMINSVLSVTGIKKFMASLEVPPVSAKALKKKGKRNKSNKRKIC